MACHGVSNELSQHAITFSRQPRAEGRVIHPQRLSLQLALEWLGVFPQVVQESGSARQMLHPKRFRAAAKRFQDYFPGTTMYAVKANPAPHVLDQIYESGIRHFDTATLPG